MTSRTRAIQYEVPTNESFFVLTIPAYALIDYTNIIEEGGGIARHPLWEVHTHTAEGRLYSLCTSIVTHENDHISTLGVASSSSSSFPLFPLPHFSSVSSFHDSPFKTLVTESGRESMGHIPDLPQRSPHTGESRTARTPHHARACTRSPAPPAPGPPVSGAPRGGRRGWCPHSFLNGSNDPERPGTT